MIIHPQDNALKLSEICCFSPAVKPGQCLWSLFTSPNIIGKKTSSEVYRIGRLKHMQKWMTSILFFYNLSHPLQSSHQLLWKYPWYLEIEQLSSVIHCLLSSTGTEGSKGFSEMKEVVLKNVKTTWAVGSLSLVGLNYWNLCLPMGQSWLR